ncbi:uncharacterized protein LOC117171655 isoform X2 [Belonocnema kinseyi]|uniref:uncharacterized protein LOC117171655 isoform X2 n=1 Tax=Belonocnema kinseyi TaxID=2817044 RepID=UPI00143DBE30|nr:uncharacterized protein LOC117171655 isoform X2 [Belonocnema kinseyi]
MSQIRAIPATKPLQGTAVGCLTSENFILEKHDVIVTFEDLVFNDANEFLQWKLKIETETQSKFTNIRGSKSINNWMKTIYRCHRSGFYAPKGEGKRHLKTIGSKKINGMCPAEMTVMVLEDGTYQVKFIMTHVGHSADLRHLQISESEKKRLAEKIVAKVPFSEILNEAKRSSGASKLERTHLLTRKDLHNIKQSFKLKSEFVRHANDAISVEVCVKQMEDTEESNNSIHTEINSVSKNQDKSGNILVIDDSSGLKAEEESILLGVLSKKKNVKSLNDEKEKVMFDLFQLVDEIQTIEQLEVLKKFMASVRPTLAALESLKETNVNPTTFFVP